MLATDWGEDQVQAALDFAERAGIRSIPVFLFELPGWERHVQGSSDEATFARVFAEAAHFAS